MKKKKKKAKRLKQPTKRTKRVRKSPYKITVRNYDIEPFDVDFEKEINIDANSTLEISINKDKYIISIDKHNSCLQIKTRETNLYLQPISIKTFLVKANSKTNES